MTDVATPALVNLPNNKVTRLANVTCAYCGMEGRADNPLTDEHVIGRRFVPKGTLARGWNLIVRACTGCNNGKADLEDDISAITLLPGLGVTHTDAELAVLAERKARGSRSRRTKKSVSDSYEEKEIAGRFLQSADVRFNLVAPPQLDPERVRRLAYLHLRGFLYLTTYDADRRAGGFVPGELGWLNEASQQDWGNSLQRGFAEFTRAWLPRVEGVVADGFFKVAIRRDPSGAELWSFAFEWNKALRIVGLFGDLGRGQLHVDAIPPLTWQRVDATHRMRREISLDPADDILFSLARPARHGFTNVTPIELWWKKQGR